MEHSRFHRSRLSRRGVWRVRMAAACGGLILLGAACRQAAPGPPAPKSVPLRGGICRLVTPVVATLDPLYVTDVYEATIIACLFNGLVRYDDALNVLPDLAEEWRVSSDGRTYTFTLRSGVRFHDGSPLEIDDVLHTFRRCLTAGGQPASSGAILERLVDQEYIDGRPTFRISARDARTLEIVLRHAYPEFLKILAMDQLRIVPRRYFPPDRKVEQPPFIGTGAFMLDVFQTDRIELKRNDHFHRSPPHLDRVRFTVTSEYSSRHNRRLFEAGQLDVMDAYSGTPNDGFMPQAQRLIQAQLTTSMLVLNCRRPPTDDPSFRKAVSLAFDRTEYLTHSHPTLKPTESFLPARMFGFSPPSGRFAFDPSAAAMHLERSRHSGGETPTLIYLDFQREPQFFNLLTDTARRLGFSLACREIPWAGFQEEIRRGDFNITIMAWTADTPIAEQYLESLLHSDSQQNVAGYRDPVVDDLIDRLYRESNLHAKLRIIQSIETRLQETVPLIPLESYVMTYLLQPHVRGARLNPFGICSLNLEEIWFDPAPR
ncbi:MAG TPA: peptide ABC transporter substrate-binding protein [Acidobacteriota bacterium]|nr:peptide ABC transporter substrate-binding protein [Acidobacteriota bacterium]